jgi:hypothetical protein
LECLRQAKSNAWLLKIEFEKLSGRIQELENQLYELATEVTSLRTLPSGWLS